MPRLNPVFLSVLATERQRRILTGPRGSPALSKIPAGRRRKS
jgi:hypothetical protein